MTRTQAFSAEQLKMIMDSTAGWADDWDDVVWYLKGPAAADTHLPEGVVESVKNAVLNAKQCDVPFTRDYRQLWTAVSGEPGDSLPAPEVRDASTDPMELKTTYLDGLSFPTDTGVVFRWAEDRGAPWRVLQTIKQLPKRQYRDIDDLLDAIGDIAWNPRG